jgi:hypothetical protein
MAKYNRCNYNQSVYLPVHLEAHLLTVYQAWGIVMKNIKSLLTLLLVSTSLLSCWSGRKYVLGDNDIRLEIDSKRSILVFHSKKLPTPLTMTVANAIPGFHYQSSHWQEHDNAIEHRSLVTDSLQRTLICRETFSIAANAIVWQVEWQSQTEKTFTVPLQTICQVRDAGSARFWTAWGDPEQTRPMQNAAREYKEWRDPLQSRNFCQRHLVYGGHHWLGGGFALPMFSVLYPDQDTGWSLIQSPLDTLLNLDLTTTSQGQCILRRSDYRLQIGKPIRFTLHLIAHEADWRPALAWMEKQYPAFFNPPNVNAGHVTGCGLYSSYEGKFDVEKYHRMGGLVNWKASFDFPYMGMFIPPMKNSQGKWQRFRIDKKQPITLTSIDQMARYAADMKSKGFHVLNYFNVTEFGADIQYPAPAYKQPAELWQDANAFLYERLHNAILFASQNNGPDGGGWGNRTPEQHMQPQAGVQTKPYFTWGQAIVTDCADSAYADFLLDQAQRHMELFPEADGICIDRMDWLAEYNSRRDDGISWIGDGPAGSLYFSWLDLLERMGPLWHNANKVIFCNPHINRLELMKQIDGIYNEFGQIGFNLNLSAFLAINKPYLAWTAGVEDLKNDPDGYLQHHLYVGAFPTAPFPGNDHTIEPDPATEQFYLDYGPLFRLLIGKKWVLTPHAVTVIDNNAKANLFQTDAGLIVPVIHAKTPVVKIFLKGIPTSDIMSCEALYPGDLPWQPLTFHAEKDGVSIRIPMQRRCAVVVLGMVKNKLPD